MDSGSCVLLADRHQGVTEGVRGLLETTFSTVFVVGDEPSLLRGAERLSPALVIVDISLAEGDLAGLLGRLATRTPQSKLLLLSVHDELTIAQTAMRAGAHGFVLTRSIATDLLPAVDAVLAGGHYLSPDIVG